jgi:2-dehydropantoate 2-reductase
MKICVFGAGALGGAFAARLAASSGARISVVARGEQLAAIQKSGLRLWEKDVRLDACVHASTEGADFGPQDLVITALKGHQVPAAAEGIAALLGPNTRVVMIQNGIPWWYFHRDFASGHDGESIPILDPSDKLKQLIGPERVIGCIAYQGAECIAPGEIRITPNGRIFLGEPSGELTPDLETVARLIEAAGWHVERTTRIRHEVWRKLMGNAAFNPISALTRATLSDLIDDPGVSGVIRDLMNEIRAVGAALGAEFDITPEKRMQLSRPMGAIKTSMLQDLERKRSLEITPLLDAPLYLGRLTKVPTPVLEVITALVKRLELSTY